MAAREYRRDGRLGAGDLLMLLAAATYGWALWTYTLLPMPAGGDYRCVSAQLDPLAFVTDLRGASGLRSPAVMQLVLNVALFVPLGFFVRALLRRGVVAATAIGFAVSLLIETTQLTGIWGLYDCAYRFFDVDDLLTNTSGAALGSLLSLPLVAGARGRRRRVGARARPDRVTLGRRLTGMVCDALFVVVSGVVLVLAWRIWLYYGLGERDLPDATPGQLLLQHGVPWLVEAVLVLTRGRTVGELAVAVHTVAPPGRAVLPARMVKLAAGVTPYVVLVAASFPLDGLVLLLLLVAHVVAAWRTPDRRGLTGVASGLGLAVDARP